MKEINLDLEGIQVRVNRWGNKKNPKIICFHGLGSTSLSFIEIGDLLKNEYCVVSIDLPGHGKTSPFISATDYEMPNMVRWLDQVISKITGDKFYLLGHSYGADIAIHYLYTYPSKVIKTMLLDGGYYLKNEWYAYQTSISGSVTSLQSEIDSLMKELDEYSFATIEEHIEVEKCNYVRWSGLLEKASKDLVKFENGKYRWHSNGSSAAEAIKSMYNYPPNSIYDKLPTSICLLQSTLPNSMIEIRDTFTRKFAYSTGCKLKKIEGAGHMIHWDKPNEVATEITCWFK